MKTKATLLFSSFLALSAWQANAQAPAIEWDKTFGGSARDELSCMTIAHDGGFVFAGLSESGISGEKTQASRGSLDIWLVRTAADGTLISERTIGGSQSDFPSSITRTPDGGYIILANSSSGISGDKDDTAKGRAGRGAAPEADLWVIKLNGTLDTIQWQKTIGGNTTDRPANIITTSDGGYIVGAYSRSEIYGDKTINRYRATSAIYDYWILKLSSTGNIEWQKVMGGDADDYMTRIRPTADGGFIAAGYYGGNTVGVAGGFDINDTSRGGNDYWVVKCDATGAIQWEQLYGGNRADVLSDIIVTSDGGYLLAGGSESEISGDKTEDLMSNNTKDYWIIKIDSLGVIEWDKVYGGTGIDEAPQAYETPDGGFIIAGESNSLANAQFTNKLTDRPDRHIWMLKLDNSGDKIWEKSIGTDKVVKFGGFLATADGGYMVGGYTDAGINGDKTDVSRGDRDFWVVKLAKDCTSDTTRTYLSASFCKGSDYTLPSGTVVNAPGVYNDTLISSANCDSVLVINVTVPTINTNVNVANGTASAAAQGASYQWIDCATNQPISGATSESYTPASGGQYKVIVTIDGCSDTSDCVSVAPSSVSDINQPSVVRFYPNPVANSIHFEGPSDMTVTIGTLDGRVAISTKNTSSINVSGLAEGVYMVRATDANGFVIYTGKMVKVQ